MTDLVGDLVSSKQQYHTREIARLDERQERLEAELSEILEEKAEHSVSWGIYEEFLATYRERSK